MNADIELPLDKMTPSEKLRLIQTILADMAKAAEEADPPAWQGRYLEEREMAIAEGRDGFIDLDEAEQDILRMTR